MRHWAWLGWLALAACAQPLHELRPAAQTFVPGPADAARKTALIALTPRLDAFFQRKLETT